MLAVKIITLCVLGSGHRVAREIANVALRDAVRSARCSNAMTPRWVARLNKSRYASFGGRALLPDASMV